MKRQDLLDKWFKKDSDYYDNSHIKKIKDDKGKSVDIALVYSGRNRGKSFRVGADALMDAWYSKGKKQLAYCRRKDKEINTFNVEHYFKDKEEFIIDLTGGKCNTVLYDKKVIYLANRNEDGKVEKILQIGYAFALSIEEQYKSLQFPLVKTMIFEEFLTLDRYLSNECLHLLSLVSTIKRGRDDFICYMIANTITRVNPYVEGFGLSGIGKQKSGTIDQYKLYKGSYGEDGLEEYFYIIAEYVRDRSEPEVKETPTKGRKRTNAINDTNRWQEANMYPNIPLSIMRKYKSKYTMIFEYDSFKFKADILHIPRNLLEYYNQNELELDSKLMPIIYITRKTSEIKKGTRTFTNRPVVNYYTTLGTNAMTERDKDIITLLRRGWVIYSDNLTANEFNQSLINLRRANY